MVTLLLVPQDDRWRARIRAALPQVSLFEAPDEAHALHQLKRINIDIVLWAGQTAIRSADFLREARDSAPRCVTVAVRRGDNEASEADYTLSDDDTPHQVEAVVRRALQRLALVRENEELRRSHPAATGRAYPAEDRHQQEGVAVAETCALWKQAERKELPSAPMQTPCRSAASRSSTIRAR